MGTRRMLVVLSVAAALTGGAAGAALAGAGEPAGPSAEQLANRCERGERLLDRLEIRAERIAGRIARIEQRLESGELGERPAARAARVLARLERRHTRISALIERLEAKLAEKCADAGNAA